MSLNSFSLEKRVFGSTSALPKKYSSRSFEAVSGGSKKNDISLGLVRSTFESLILPVLSKYAERFMFLRLKFLSIFSPIRSGLPESRFIEAQRIINVKHYRLVIEARLVSFL